MADIVYSEAQLAAIEHRGAALLISAAAGSGKTRVLVERLMRSITGEDPRDIDRFLVITYTRAAAAELRGRILEELSKRLVENPGSRHLRRQVSLIYKAQISTIHSFCSTIIRESAHLHDIRPDFRILETSEADIMKNEVLEEVLEKRYEEMSGPFRLLVDTMSAGRDDSALCAIILDTYSRLQSHPDPLKWLQDRINDPLPEGDVGGTVWGELLLRRAKEKTEYWIGRMETAIDMLGFDSKMSSAYEPSFLATLDSLKRLVTCISEGWDSVYGFGTVEFPRLSPLRGYGDDETVAYVKEIRNACNKAMGSLLAEFDAKSDELLEDLAAVRPAVDELFRIVLDFSRAFYAEKKKRGVLDFNDLEHLALKLLIDDKSGEPTAFAIEISERFDEILVDEYQDVNRVQDMIFSAISRKGKNITMVGDVKQSIYRFRLADPTVFLGKYERFADAPEPEEPRRILLSNNYRSRRGILEAVNYLFAGIMSRKLGEMEYTEKEFLRPAATYPDTDEEPFEINVLDMSDMDPEVNKYETEAAFVADRIKSLMDKGINITSGGATRPLQYGDIAILMRSLKGREEVFVEALGSAGIPAVTQRAISIFENPEITLLLSLLKVIDNPMQDVPLIAVLRSALCGMSVDELAEIRCCDRKSDFFTALKKKAQMDKERGEGGKPARFLEQLEDFRSRAADYSTDRLLRYIYDTTGLTAIASADNPGAASRLLMILEYARQFEAKGYRGLFSFVSHLDEMSKQSDPPLKALPSGSGNEVLITSIHSSKGLEYPVVILADLARQFNKEDIRKPLLVHQDLGVGPKRLDLERRIEYPTIARRAVAARLLEEMLSEEMRLMYVAMTRAREKLIAVMTLRDAGKKLQKLGFNAEYPLNPQVLEGSESMADWLLLAALSGSGWKLNIKKPVPSSEEGEPEDIDAAEPSPELIEKIESNLRYTYPHMEASKIPSKLTATELKGSYFAVEAAEEAESFVEEPREFIFRRPKFAMEERGLTAAEKGTALHIVMQHISFAHCRDTQGIQKEIERLRHMRILSPEQADSVSPEPILRFFGSQLGQKVLDTPPEMLKREFKFSILTRAGDILPDGGDEEILLQGVIDLCTEDEKGLTIIDFKTDKVNEITQYKRAEYYKGQMLAYGLAMEKITGKPVCRRLIYFFNTGETIDV